MAVAAAVPFDPLDALIDGTFDELDITKPMHDFAVAKHGTVGGFLTARGAAAGIDVLAYAQGSLRIGTPILPLAGGDFDIDTVLLYGFGKGQISQDQLKLRAGLDLHAFLQTPEAHADGLIRLEEGSRAWTLSWPQHNFHMDVLPAIPKLGVASDTAIQLPDRDLVIWQDSDPRGFAIWFAQRAERRLVFKEARAQVEAVPVFRNRNPLQRAVQVLKRHRDLYFQHDDENKPASVIVTTLAAHAYDGRADIFSAVVAIASTMEQYIEKRGIETWVQNPVVPTENFAHKWVSHPVREQRFQQWMADLNRELQTAQTQGWPAAVPTFERLFGAEPVQKAAVRIGNDRRALREQGAITIAGAAATLSTGAGTKLRDHTFHGE
ncbi:MAG: hypothetical protein ACREN2_11965 [Candidatus Dormibacteria bacterium]